MEPSEWKTPVIRDRIQKLKKLRDMGFCPYPTGYKKDLLITEAIQRFGNLTNEELSGIEKRFSLAGRLVSKRDFGKACFAHIKDATGKIQIYVKRDNLEERQFEVFRQVDIGDLVLVAGKFFRTKTDEFTLLVQDFVILSKSIRPLPEKWHGLTDVETRYRQRYLDLIMNENVMQTFLTRTRIIKWIRSFFDEKGFIEVETPMMQPIPGGATARPFKTYHNALDTYLYLRIAPELYLKRLIVGGFEKVYELNRNFRNEGISIKHNPEFTMLEFYWAYATFEDLMALTEELFYNLALSLTGGPRIHYQGHEIDLTPPWKRIRLFDALKEVGGVPQSALEDLKAARSFADRKGVLVTEKENLGKVIVKLFDALVEPNLIQPTFVVEFPVSVSPLSRRNDRDPSFVDRFELFVGGRELANAFNELNDPFDQRERFLEQVKEREAGDEEALFMDEDFLVALEHGMPPTAGEGIGIDRVVMLFTDSPSIRDVILFPQLRPK
jgi:lysyl-tRNA synthetase class 2